MKEVQLYTDGACRGNPGKGGWGAVLVYGRHEKTMSGGERETTNNRMELTAAIEGLSALKEPCSVKLYSDSKYLVDGFSLGWVYGWEKKNWSKVKNPDLWERLLELSRIHNIEFIWIKGHNGHEYNERCDRLACDFADSFED